MDLKCLQQPVSHEYITVSYPLPFSYSNPPTKSKLSEVFSVLPSQKLQPHPLPYSVKQSVPYSLPAPRARPCSQPAPHLTPQYKRAMVMTPPAPGNSEITGLQCSHIYRSCGLTWDIGHCTRMLSIVYNASLLGMYLRLVPSETNRRAINPGV